jgi:hypothetical protein
VTVGVYDPNTGEMFGEPLEVAVFALGE